ncbi:MAG TPA: hypothetical protein VGK58_00650 [Lacipirellulaceae bacterium]
MKRIFWVAAIFAATSPAVYGQTVIVDENFDSYASEAELHEIWAGFWNSGSFTPSGTAEQVEDRFQLIAVSGGDNADFNGNNLVDAADYVLWRKNNGLMGGATQAQGDANGDGNVDAADYSAWVAGFGSTPTPGGGGQAVQHLANFVNQDPSAGPVRVTDGNLVYQPLLDPNFVEPGYPGGDGSIFPSQGEEPIVLRGDIFTPSSATQRNTIGLRYFDGASLNANLIEMGLYNDGNATPLGNPPGTTGAANHGSDGNVTGNRAFALFGIRAQLFQLQSDANPNWQYFAMDPLWDTNGNGLVTASEAFSALGITEGWHTLEATITPEEDGADGDVTMTFTLDLLRDGMNNAQNMPGVDGTITVTNLRVTQAGFNSLRIGGPSGLYTPLEAMFDNIFLSGPQVPPLGSGVGAAVPEPSAVGLCALAALGVFGMRRRD